MCVAIVFFSFLTLMLAKCPQKLMTMGGRGCTLHIWMHYSMVAMQYIYALKSMYSIKNRRAQFQSEPKNIYK